VVYIHLKNIMDENIIENNDSENVDEEVETSEEETTEEDSNEDELTDREKQFLARAKKAEKKLKAEKKTLTEDKPKEEPKESSLDYGQKAFLVAEGVKRGEETNLVEEFMETGKSLEEILDSRVFQAELKSLREDIKAKEATPSNSKRSTSTSRDKVEYWVNKGELPPIDQVELRRAVVNAKVKSENSGSNFTGNPTGTIIVK